MSASAAVKGQCLCGAVRIEASPARTGLAACHCGMCRRWTSSALIVFEAAAGTVHADGPIRTFQSSDWAERAFCDRCGSPLWYRITAEGPMYDQHQVSAGLFDNAADLMLSLEVFIDRKPDGYAFAGERRTMTEAEVIAAFAPPQQGAPNDQP